MADRSSHVGDSEDSEESTADHEHLLSFLRDFGVASVTSLREQDAGSGPKRPSRLVQTHVDDDSDFVTWPPPGVNVEPAETTPPAPAVEASDATTAQAWAAPAAQTWGASAADEWTQPPAVAGNELPPTGWSQPPAGPPAGSFWSMPVAQGYGQTGPGGFTPAVPTPPPSRQSVLPGSLSTVNLKNRSIRAVVAMIVAVLAGGGLYFHFSASTKPTLEFASPSAGLRDAVLAAQRAGSVHILVGEVQDGQTMTMSIDSTTNGSLATVTIGHDSLTLKSIGPSAYIKANAGYLTHDLAMPASLASKYSGKWLEVPSDANDLGVLATGFAMPSIITNVLSLSGPLTMTPTAGPEETRQIRGTVPATSLNQGSGAGDVSTLTVSNWQPHYPVSVAFGDPTNGTVRMTFSHWGEHVALAAPVGAIVLPKK